MIRTWFQYDNTFENEWFRLVLKKITKELKMSLVQLLLIQKNEEKE